MDQSYSDTSRATARRTLVGLFDSADEADAAVRELIAFGIRREDIDRHARVGGTTTAGTDTSADEGWWESLKRLFMPDEDTHAYGEGIRRGGVVVTVHATEAENDRVIDILEQHGSVDLDARTEEWRSSGWTPGMTAAAGTTPDHAAASATRGTAAMSGGTTPGTATGTGIGTGTAASAAGEEVRIPVAHEELQIGKRDVERGRVRIRAYVTQRPVSEQVSLRHETVTVAREPARGGAVAGDPFQERSLEVRETAEEAVVSKTARVDEEVVVRKGVEQEQRTVSDKVRETKVEVDDDRKTRPGAATPPGRR